MKVLISKFIIVLLLGCSSSQEDERPSRSRSQTANKSVRDESSSTQETVQNCDNGTKKVDVDSLLELAQKCFNEKKIRRSYFLYKSALSNPKVKSSQKYKILNNLGVIQSLLGHDSRSYSLFEKSTATKANKINAHNKIQAQINKGAYKLDANLVPIVTNGENHSLNGAIHLYEKNKDEMKSSYKKTLKQENDYTNYLYALKSLGLKKELEREIKNSKWSSSNIKNLQR